MKEKDNQITLEVPRGLISNEFYFKYIFKKTEKIACAVFYILHNVSDNLRESDVVNVLKKSAEVALDGVLESLTFDADVAPHTLRGITQKLLALESKLRIAHAAGVIGTDHLNVFVSEIDTTLRSIRSFVEAQNKGTLSTSEDAYPTITVGPRPRQRASVTPIPNGREKRPLQSTVHTRTEGRIDRITAVLKAQPNASIKDISDTIKDVSEKTIQRDLNDLIKDGVVIREGERRWSRYRLAFL